MKNLAQIAYEAYCEFRQWKSFNNEDLPQWNEVRLDIKEAWEESIDAVIEEIASRLRERK